MKLVITTATGTVGSEVVSALQHRQQPDLEVIVTSRHEDKLTGGTKFFDYELPERSAAALEGVDGVFLLLAPGLVDVKERFSSLLEHVQGPKPHVVFMSVQGAEHRSFLPHAKAEAAIRAATSDFTFLRPSYFVQNLETAFGKGIRDDNELVAPAGEAEFRWIDAADIGWAAAEVLLNPAAHKSRAYTLAGELATLGDAANILSQTLGREIHYKSPGPIPYYCKLRSADKQRGMALAQTGIHFVERFTAPAPASPDFTYLTGNKPTTLRAYVEKHREVWV